MGSPQTVKKVKNGATYYYERTPKYDPKTRNTSYKYRYLGKDMDGKIGKVRVTLPRRSYIYGSFLPLIRVMDTLHLSDILTPLAGKKRSAEILALAMSKVVRPLPMKSIPVWMEGTHLPDLLHVDLSSPGISRLLDRIGESDLYRSFSKHFISYIKPEGSLLYDITTVPSYSSLAMFEYGHAKDHPDLPQLNLSIVMEKKRFLPISFETYSGSIPDIVTLKRMVTDLGIEGIEFILDRGFFSLDNLRMLSGHDYIIAAVYSRKEVKAAFSSAMKTLDRADNAILYEGRTMFCLRLSFRMEELDLMAYLYHDPERETEERMNFHRTLMQKREEIEKLQVRKGLGTAISAIAGSYMKYISYTVKEGKIVTRARNNAITAAENRMGRFMIVYSGDHDPVTCLSMYRQKDAIEKAFMMLKTDLDLFPLRARKPSTVSGTIFVLFIALIMRSMIVRAMNLSGLAKKYSVERMFLELEKLQIIKKDDGTFEELERTKKQRDILTALEKISWG